MWLVCSTKESIIQLVARLPGPRTAAGRGDEGLSHALGGLMFYCRKVVRGDPTCVASILRRDVGSGDMAARTVHMESIAADRVG